MSNQLQRLAMMHAALVPEIKTLAERFADALVLVEALGHQINAALASSDESPAQTFDQLGGFGFDRGPEPVIPEMAVHVPSAVPPPVETNEIGAIVHSAEFAPDHEPTTSPAHDADCCLVDNHDGPCLDTEDATVVNPEDMKAPPTSTAKPKRAKTEYTAQEWADSMHFLSFMKKQPFNTWTAEQQNAKRDEFVASVSADERMNRWGQRFAKFCGVSA